MGLCVMGFDCNQLLNFVLCTSIPKHMYEATKRKLSDGKFTHLEEEMMAFRGKSI